MRPCTPLNCRHWHPIKEPYSRSRNHFQTLANRKHQPTNQALHFCTGFILPSTFRRGLQLPKLPLPLLHGGCGVGLGQGHGTRPRGLGNLWVMQQIPLAAQIIELLPVSIHIYGTRLSLSNSTGEAASSFPGPRYALSTQSIRNNAGAVLCPRGSTQVPHKATNVNMGTQNWELLLQALLWRKRKKKCKLRETQSQTPVIFNNDVGCVHGGPKQAGSASSSPCSWPSSWLWAAFPSVCNCSVKMLSHTLGTSMHTAVENIRQKQWDLNLCPLTGGWWISDLP